MKTSDTHISIDVEACGEVLLSIGACEFNPGTGGIGRTFYVSINPADQLSAGLRVSADAFTWWLQQSDGARQAVVSGRISTVEALHKLRVWWEDKDAWCWAYPTSFDLPLMAKVYEAMGSRPPWRWKRTVDGRTLWQLACLKDPSAEKIESEPRTGCEHHALDDAIEQSAWYTRYMAIVVGTAT